MNNRSIRLSFLTVLFACVASVPVWAAGSGAFRVELPDAEAMGKGSAFVGEADNAAAVYYNPAGTTQLEGNHLRIGFSTLSPHVDFTNTAGNNTEMERDTFIIPHFYYVSDLGLEKVKFGVGVTSNWGSATSWKDHADATKYVATQSELVNTDFYFTTAYEMNDQLSLAVSLDYTDSTLSKSKKLNQAIADGNFQVKGDDAGVGYRLAAHYKPNHKHSFGVMYRSEIDLKYRGEANLTGLNAVNVLSGLPVAGTSNYQAVFGGSSYSTPMTADLTLPQSIVLGYSYKPSDKWRFNFDLEWMDWSSVEYDKVDFTSETDLDRLAVLSSGNPEAKDWESAISFGAGAEYAMSDRMRLRGGYFYHETPIKSDANFNPNLPDNDSHSVTTGLGFDVTDSATIDLAYSLMMFEDRDVANNALGAASGANVNGTYEEYINLFLVSIGIKL